MSDRDERKREIVRWIASIGIFYIFFPLAWLAAGFVYQRFIRIDVIQRLGSFRFPLGIAVLAGGALLTFSAFRSQLVRGRGHPFFTGNEKLARPTKKLLTNGVYLWSRNPMNLGDMMIYVGLSIAAGCDGGLVINAPLYYLLIWANSRFFERKGLLKRFGGDYLEYERTTSPIVPGPKSFKKVLCKRAMSDSG